MWCEGTGAGLCTENMNTRYQRKTSNNNMTYHARDLACFFHFQILDGDISGFQLSLLHLELRAWKRTSRAHRSL